MREAFTRNGSQEIHAHTVSRPRIEIMPPKVKLEKLVGHHTPFEMLWVKVQKTLEPLSENTGAALESCVRIQVEISLAS